MAQRRLRPEDALALLTAIKEHGTVVGAARALKIPRGTADSRLQTIRINEWTLENLPSVIARAGPQPLPEPDLIREPLANFEEAWQQWQTAIGMARDRYVQNRRQLSATAGVSTQKILVVPDLHAPFHEAEMFAAMLEAEADADHAICIGDLGDAYALSQFTKYERMPFRDEWASVTLCLQELASRFPKVTLVIGNHDARLEKRLRERLTEDMVDAISFMTGGVLCPLTALAKRYPNVDVARHETPSGKYVDWFTTVGDAWLGHPEKFSRVPGSALRFTEEWIADNEHALGIEHCRLVVMGHTHTYTQIPWRADKLLVECGCLARQQGYMLSPRIGGRPQRRGYLTFVQEDGRTDLNSVRFFGFDWVKVA